MKERKRKGERERELEEGEEEKGELSTPPPSSTSPPVHLGAAVEAESRGVRETASVHCGASAAVVLIADLHRRVLPPSPPSSPSSPLLPRKRRTRNIQEGRAGGGEERRCFAVPHRS
ncbi:uncharacterized protein DS421_16g538570 [Arachis hypogaea]|nr:uncharacterized protein DS421_16g538570 [Arachis hypogaea]